jgi:hypothetical protein
VHSSIGIFYHSLREDYDRYTYNSAITVNRNRQHLLVENYTGTLWLTGARKEAKPAEARPVEPRVRPDRVRRRA